MTPGETVFTSDRLTIRRSAGRQQYILYWSGECDFRNPMEMLGPTLNSLPQDLRDRQLVLDFQELTFMNSSSVTPILSLVKGVCSKGGAVHLIYNSNLSWQRTTASSMRVLAHALKTLTVALQAS